MTKLTRFLAGASVISAAAVLAATHSGWSGSTRLILLSVLLAALVTAGIFAIRSRSAEERRVRTNLSPGLATLSSAAILAIYAAGYHRTSATAGGGFGEQSNRRSGPVAIASGAVPGSPLPQIEPGAKGSNGSRLTKRSGLARRNDRRAKSSGDDRNAPTFSINAAPPVAPRAPQSASGPAAMAAPQIATTTADVSVPAATGAPQRPSLYKDGTYSGWGSCRHGDIQASVTIQEGKIASVAITQCLTRYSCSWIANLPGQVVQRQSPEVDYVSGASQSTDAFYGAVVAALSKARN